MSRVQLYEVAHRRSHAGGQATALVYATEACEYEREIRPRVSDLSPVTAANSARLWGSFDPAGNHPEATERTA